jgi:hypothetical protein
VAFQAATASSSQLSTSILIATAPLALRCTRIRNLVAETAANSWQRWTDRSHRPEPNV